MMNSVHKNYSENQDARLEEVLKACIDESEISYNLTLNVIDRLVESLYNSEREIKQGCENIERLSLADTSLEVIANELKNQLITIEQELRNDVEGTLADLRIKRQHDSNFNITLFGRTMVGKSTLMSILTRANEGEIGNGAQRTTRDIREYEWKGMKITDVPGIEAFDGEEDDRIAEIGAKNADLIIFMISSGQPESSEAEWLIKLKKEDKAIICLCNYKKNLGSKTGLRLALRDKDAFMKGMNLEGLKKQFNEFLTQELPNEKIEIHVAQLLAERMAEDPEYAEYRADLSEISKFSEFKESLISLISTRGIFFRRKSYLALIDAPVYNHYIKLNHFTNTTYAGVVSVDQKKEEFLKWRSKFNESEKELLVESIHNIYNQVRSTTADFVEANFQSRHVKRNWIYHLKYYDLDSKINRALKESVAAAENKITNIFSDLGKDLEIIANFDTYRPLNRVKRVTDWKKIHGWGSAIAGIGATVGFLLLNSSPVGWIFTGLSLAFGLFSWLSKPKEDKLRSARKQMYQNIIDSLRKSEEKSVSSVVRQFEEIVINKIETTALARLDIIESTLSTVLSVEQRCAMEYCSLHTEISRQLIDTVLEYETSLNSGRKHLPVRKVARIPGKIIVIATNEDLEESTRKFISDWMGSGEKVEVMILSEIDPLPVLVKDLGNKFVPGIPLRISNNKNGQVEIVAPKISYSQQQLDGIDLMQQLLNKQIILSNV